MGKSALTAIYGIGPDSKGLVGRLAGAIAALGGNIVDLDQNVTHGQFSFFCLVEFSAESGPQKLEAEFGKIQADTGLFLHASGLHSVKRIGERKGLFLLTLIGPDKPGIIAQIAQTLGRYSVNIEESRNVAREGVFLMEMLADFSESSLPEANLRKTIADLMRAEGIGTMFQFENVFNKKKRVILFDIRKSLLESSVRSEILKQTGLDAKAIGKGSSEDEETKAAAALLEGSSTELLEKIASSFSPSEETVELVQELKRMGYKVAIATRGFSFFASKLKELVGADYAWGIELDIDPDTLTVSGGAATDESVAERLKRFVAELSREEGIRDEDLVSLSDSGNTGIRLEFDPKFLLDAFNRKALSRDSLSGVLGSFGLLSSGGAK